MGILKHGPDFRDETSWWEFNILGVNLEAVVAVEKEAGRNEPKNKKCGL